MRESETKAQNKKAGSMRAKIDVAPPDDVSEPHAFETHAGLHEKDLAVLVTFLLILIAALLMLDARRGYVFEAVAQQHGEGAVAIPPM